MYKKLQDMIKELEELPEMHAESELWVHKVNEMLNVNSTLNGRMSEEFILNRKAELRCELNKAIAESSRLSMRHEGIIAMLGLYAACISAGKSKEMLSVAQASEDDDEGKCKNDSCYEDDKNLKSGIIVILEKTKVHKDGVFRTWCETGDGNRTAVFSEGEVAKIFQNSSKGQKLEALFVRVDNGLSVKKAKKLA